MTTVACMIVLDGEPWLGRSVFSLQGAGVYAKQIVIVEGAVPTADRSPDKDGWCSRDGTRETLQGFSDAGVTVIKAGNQPNKIEMWNLALGTALDRHPDATSVLFLDSDEILPPGLHVRDLEQYARALDIVRLDFPMVHFFRDIDHRVVGGPWAEPHRRFWLLPEDPSFQNHRPPWMWGENEPSALVWAPLYHYGWVDLGERTIEKCRFYERLRPNHPTFGRHVQWYHEVFKDSSRTYAVHITEIDDDRGSRVVPWSGRGKIACR